MADDSTAINNTGWMSDVQRALALLLIGTVAFMVITLTIRMVFTGDQQTVSALLKELKDALTNMSLIALGFFFGNTMAKMAQDVGQQKVVEKLTGTPSGPVAPPPVVVAWWSVLTPVEQATITEAALTDPRVAAFVGAASTGKATPDDLTYLVGKGLLTQERASAIAALSAMTSDNTLKAAAVAAAAAAAPAAAAAVAPAAAAAVAAAAAAAVAPAAAAVVAPPAASVAAPPAARQAVAEAMAEQGLTPKPKEPT